MEAPGVCTVVAVAMVITAAAPVTGTLRSGKEGGKEEPLYLLHLLLWDKNRASDSSWRLCLEVMKKGQMETYLIQVVT